MRALILVFADDEKIDGPTIRAKIEEQSYALIKHPSIYWEQKPHKALGVFSVPPAGQIKVPS